MPLDSVTVSALAAELRSKLVGGKIDKVQQPERDTILLTIRTPAHGNVRLAICGGVGNSPAGYGVAFAILGVLSVIGVIVMCTVDDSLVGKDI